MPTNMPLYRGTKTVHAYPMTKGEYCAYRKWEVPANEVPGEQGFLIEYTDGGEPNDERHKGYITWSPADVFERAYRPCDTYIDRLRIEVSELADRATKLSAFIHDSGGKVFSKIGPEQQELMRTQLAAMRAYQDAIAKRLELATKEDLLTEGTN